MISERSKRRQILSLVFILKCVSKKVSKKLLIKGLQEKKVRDNERFPFDQIFRFEIPSIFCDEWKRVFQLVGIIRPRPSVFKFRTKIRNQTEVSLPFQPIFDLLLGLLDYSEFGINDVRYLVRMTI